MKISFTLGVIALCAVSLAQFSDNFESETGSAGGTALTSGFGGGGQNGWYNPVTGSADGMVFTYAGNTPGFVSNASGGNQFVGLSTGPANQIARAQHAMGFGAGAYTVTFDFNANFLGTPPAADNLGSFSLQPSGSSNFFQTIYQWGTNTATPTVFNANIGSFSATGTASAGADIVFSSPGAAWTNLPVNHWYRQSVTWSFTTNTILATSIQDLTVGGPLNVATPVGMFLAGGAANVLGLATPTDVRLFAGGSTGNVMAWDNFSVAPVPEPATLAALGLGAAALMRRRRKA